MWPAWEHTLLIFAAGLLEGAVGFDFGLIAKRQTTVLA